MDVYNRTHQQGEKIMNECTEFKNVMRELIDANNERVEAYGDRDRLNKAIARIEVITRKAEALLERSDNELVGYVAGEIYRIK